MDTSIITGGASEDVTVYRKHGMDGVEALEKAGTGAGGTCTLDESNGRITIYATKFSTCAVAYTEAGQTYVLTVNGGSSEDSISAVYPINVWTAYRAAVSVSGAPTEEPPLPLL